MFHRLFICCFCIYSFFNQLYAEPLGYVNYQGGSVVVFDTADNSLTGTTISIGGSSASIGGIAITADGTTAYAVNYGAGTLVPIDLATNTAGTAISVGSNPGDVALNSTHAFVSRPLASEVVKVLLSDGSIADTISVDTGPEHIAITSDGAKAFVSCSSFCDVIDTVTSATNSIIPGGFLTGSIAISDTQGKAYVTLQNGDVVQIDTTTEMVTGSNITVSATYVYGIAVSPDGNQAYVTTDKTDTDFSIIPIDLTSNTVGTAVTASASFASPFYLAYTPDGNTIYVTSSDPEIFSVDTQTNMAGTTITSAGISGGIAIAPASSPGPSGTVQIPTTGLSGNNLAVANYLNTLANVSSLQSILSDLANLSGTALQNALISIDPLRISSSNFSLINMQFIFGDILLARSTNQRILRNFPSLSQVSASPSSFDTGWLTASAQQEEKEEILLPAKEKKRTETNSVWAEGFGAFIHENGKDTNPSFDTTTGGVLIAYDWFNRESILLGGGAGYARNALDQEQNLGESTSDTVLTTFYASYFYRTFFLDLALWGGHNWIHTDRNVSFPGFSKHAKAKFQSWQLVPHLDFGYSWLFSWGGLEPFASLDWAVVFTEGFREKGADPLNMQVQSQTSSMLRAEAGINIYEQVERETGIFIARQTLSYVYKKPFSVGRVTAAVVGQPGSFVSETFLDAQNLFSPSLELFFKRNNGIFGSLTYLGEFGSGYVANEVFGKVGIYF